MGRYEIHLRYKHVENPDRVSGIIVKELDKLRECKEYVKKVLKNVEVKIYDTRTERWVL